MAEHDCIQREEVSSLKTSMERLNKEMFNGEGIIKQVPVLNSQVEELTIAVKDLRTAISGLNKFMDELRGGQNTIKNTVPWIAVIIAGLTLTFSMYNNNRVNRLKEEQMYIDWKMEFKQDKVIDSTTRSVNVLNY